MKTKSKQKVLAGLDTASKPKYSPLNPNVPIVPAKGPRQIPFEPEPDTDRDEILRKAYAYLAGHSVPYVPLDIEEDIQTSYEDDTLEEFRETVRGWIRELVRVAAHKLSQMRGEGGRPL